VPPAPCIYNRKSNTRRKKGDLKKDRYGKGVFKK
jgi:hypothetical protein